MATNHIRKSHQPARARQVERSMRRKVAARSQAAPEVSRVYKAKWGNVGAVLVCEEHAKLLGAMPTPCDQYDLIEMECFVCSRRLEAKPLKEAA